MDTETLKDKAVFGRSAAEECEPVFYSTACRSVDCPTVKITKSSSSGWQTSYTLNLSDQKRRNAYRRINKMMRGYQN